MFDNLPAVPQRGGNGIDRKLDSFSDPFVGFTRAVAFHEFDLEQVERLDIWQPQPNGVVKRGAGLKQMALPGRVEQAVA